MALGTMKLRIFVFLAMLICARASSFCQEVVEPLGYGCTEFTVETRDGFLLALHRLSKTGSLARNSRASSPAGSPANIPAFAPTGDSTASEASGPAPSSMLLSKNLSDYNSTMVTVSSNASTQIHSPKPASRIRGHGSQHFNTANTSIQDGRPLTYSGPFSRPVSSSRTSSTNNTSEMPPAAAGPSVVQNSLNSSTHSQRTTGTGSPSSYTIIPGAGRGAPVLLMHQEFVSGQIWFEFVDRNRSIRGLLPIMLLNDGFDVWIGHSRASRWGHGHIALTSTNRAYWNWSWDQLVEFDLPAQLLFISAETNQPVHFVGASQAAAVGVAAATDHDTAQLIRSLTLIGPTVYRGYTNSRLLEAWAYYFGLTLDSEYYVTGYQNGAFNYTLEFPETGPFSAEGLSGTAIGLISGPNCCLSDAAPIQFTNGWDGTTSFKNLLHWQQGIRANTFAHFDYGNAARNLLVYGQRTPPGYYIAQIPRRMPILVIAGGQDYEAPPPGIRLLLSALQQPVQFINLTDYAHYDLGFSTYREKDIYLPLLRYLEGPRFL